MNYLLNEYNTFRRLLITSLYYCVKHKIKKMLQLLNYSFLVPTTIYFLTALSSCVCTIHELTKLRNCCTNWHRLQQSAVDRDRVFSPAWSHCHDRGHDCPRLTVVRRRFTRSKSGVQGQRHHECQRILYGLEADFSRIYYDILRRPSIDKLR